MKFAPIFLFLTIASAPARADSLPIEVHQTECIAKSIDEVQKVVANYPKYVCNPNVKLTLSGEILKLAGLTKLADYLSEHPSDKPTQLAALVYSGAKEAPLQGPSDSGRRDAQWVWLEFQPLNVGCLSDSADCEKSAEVYPRFMLYCLAEKNANDTQISNHCVYTPQKHNQSPLLNDFAVDSYNGTTVLTANAPGCAGGTSVKVDIVASLKTEDLNQAIDKAADISLFKWAIKNPTLQKVSYERYFSEFNAGFIDELKHPPRECTAPAAELVHF